MKALFKILFLLILTLFLNQLLMAYEEYSSVSPIKVYITGYGGLLTSHIPDEENKDSSTSEEGTPKMSSVYLGISVMLFLPSESFDNPNYSIMGPIFKFSYQTEEAYFTDYDSYYNSYDFGFSYNSINAGAGIGFYDSYSSRLLYMIFSVKFATPSEKEKNISGIIIKPENMWGLHFDFGISWEYI
ncbi:MAG TPA: hypothetical protein PKW55_03095 [Spirochaetota bacterium]|nr:hypothetical protein [Spirochaetota bacterium]HOM38163.1 hypothetical protein [Spirochaetota bacterium]HPQ48619.1 hypothetical protein [Spirochaetota bacterium]